MYNLSLLLKILVISILWGRGRSAQNETFAPNVFYGDPARIEDFPFYAGLVNCGSAILEHYWVLTAAHCMNDPRLRSGGFVWVGGNYFSNSIRVPYHHVIVHPEYQVYDGVHLNDLALIRLSVPLQYSDRVQPVRLPLDNYYQIRNLVAVGRGLDEVNTFIAFAELKSVALIRLTPDECLRVVPPYYSQFGDDAEVWLNTIHICTIREGRIPNVCRGDSGGPLVSGDILIGVVSFGSIICSRGNPNFFTNVHFYLHWIEAVTGLPIQ